MKKEEHEGGKSFSCDLAFLQVIGKNMCNHYSLLHLFGTNLNSEVSGDVFKNGKINIWSMDPAAVEVES